VSRKTLVVGVGSPIRGDDAVGPVVGERLQSALGDDCIFEPFQGSGLDLLGILAQEDPPDRVVIIDSIVSGQVPEGQVVRVQTDGHTGSSYLSSHHVGVFEAFNLARRLGVAIPEVRLYAVGIRRVDGFREGLSESLACKVDEAVRRILDDLS